MPKRFLQSYYEQLTKKELVKAIYSISDKASATLHGAEAKRILAEIRVRKLTNKLVRLQKQIARLKDENKSLTLTQ